MMCQWVGGRDEAAEGSWAWKAGETWDYSNWDCGNSQEVDIIY